MPNFDGSLKFDTKIDTQGFNKGTKDITSQMGTLVKSIKAVGVALAGSFVIKSIKSTIEAAEELQNAMTGLKSIMDGQGKSFSNAQKFITEYTEDGLIPASNAITAYKNLALRGYDTSQIQAVMNALKDSATYGRQSAYTLGEAVQTASEGLKNENSILVDNAGVTKNVAKMWDEYAKTIGKNRNNLTQQEKIQAEVNGILEETKFQTGDAATYMNSYSGQIARLNQQWLTFKQTIGTAFMTLAQAVLPVINAIMNALIKLASVFKMVITTLFGKLIKTNDSVSKSAVKASDSIAGMGDAAESAGKQANEALAPFDKLNVLQQDSGSGSGSDSGGGIDIPELGEIEIDTEEIEEIPEILQKVLDRIKLMLDRLKDAFEPTITAWTESFKNLWTNVQPIITQFGTNLKALFTDVLSPLVESIIFDFVAPVSNAFSKEFAPIFTGFILQQLQLFVDTFGNYVSVASELVDTVFIPAIQQLSDTLVMVMPTIMDSLQIFFDLITEVGDYILNEFLLPVGKEIIETFAPAFTDILSVAIEEFSKNFETAMNTIKSAWENIFKPTLELIKKIALEILQTIKDKWEEYSDDILENTKTFFEKLREHWDKLYTEILEPIVKPFLKELEEAWDTYVKETVEELVDFVHHFINSALEIYNEFIAPIVNWLLDVLKPAFLTVFEIVKSHILNYVSFISDKVKAIITVLRGLIDFMKGVFTADWQGAWEGLKTIVTGVWDRIWAAIKTMINNIIDGINAMINGLNSVSFDVPDWVPGIGGGKFGFDIPTIPRLATGAVIPPNSEFVAVLGDQKNGRNLEAPEDLIRQIVREETEALASRPIYVRTEISGKTLMDIIAEQQEERERAFGYDTGGGSFAY